MAVLPRGSILMWSGSITTIPSGFVLCNGAGGTPDLRDRFIVGAGTTYDPADTGGSTMHQHAFTGDGHTHSIPLDGIMAAGDDYSTTTGSTEVTGTTDNTDGRPPYYALAYIMKT